MGAVYLAEHPFMGRKAAIKVLRREFAEDRNLVDRFMNEARAANAIRHANIIDIIDVGQLPSGVPYLMMEFLEGESLANRLSAAGRLPLAEAIDIAIQTATALSAAHAKGIVHRDLKPDNLFLLPDESRQSGLRVKVLDFGIAKLRGDMNGTAAKTQSGSLMGTPPYMSPEQCRGLPDEIDERTDIYALGIILYQLLCGAPPFVSQGWGEIVLMHLTQAPEPPRARNPEIPADVEAIILRALEKDRAARFASMIQICQALQATTKNATAKDATAKNAATVPSGGTKLMPVGVSENRSGGVVATTTTFRTATGEVRTLSRATGSRKTLFAGIAVAVATVGIGGVLLSRKTQQRQNDPATPPVAASTSLSSAPRELPRPKEDVAPLKAASAPTLPSVRLASEPSGATVIDVATGRIVGTTPLDQTAPRGEGAWDLRVQKDGFRPTTLAVPLGEAFDRTIALEAIREDPPRRVAKSAREKARRQANPAPPDVWAKSNPTRVAAPPLVPLAPSTPPRIASPKPAAEKW